MDSFHPIDLHGQFSLLSRPPKGENYELFDTKEDRRQRRQLDNLICHHHHHHFVYINILCTLVTLKSSFQDHLKWHSLSSIRAKSHKDYILPRYNSMLSHPLHHRHLTFKSKLVKI